MIFNRGLRIVQLQVFGAIIGELCGIHRYFVGIIYYVDRERRQRRAPYFYYIMSIQLKTTVLSLVNRIIPCTLFRFTNGNDNLLNHNYYYSFKFGKDFKLKKKQFQVKNAHFNSLPICITYFILYETYPFNWFHFTKSSWKRPKFFRLYNRMAILIFALLKKPCRNTNFLRYGKERNV